MATQDNEFDLITNWWIRIVKDADLTTSHLWRKTIGDYTAELFVIQDLITLRVHGTGMTGDEIGSLFGRGWTAYAGYFQCNKICNEREGMCTGFVNLTRNVTGDEKNLQERVVRQRPVICNLDYEFM